jgi:SAM-dependent methyltransferase
MNPYQFRQAIQFFNKQHEDLGKPQEEWSKNTEANIHRYSKKDSIWTLKGILEGDNEKAVVVVGASPSLMGSLDELKSLDREKFLLMCVNSSLKILLKHGIKPDYVVAVDGNPRSIIDDLDCDSEDLTLICSSNVCPGIFDVWKGKNILWLPYYSIRKDLKRKVRYKLGGSISMGGNTFSAAMSLAYIVFGAKIFVLVGNELCYDEQYYPHKLSKWENPETLHFCVKDVNGRQRYTNLPLFQYKMWIEKMITELSDECIFYDTSFGLLGTDCNVIHILSLAETKIEIMNAFATRELAKTDWRVREKLRYDAAYASTKYIPENAMFIYGEIMDKLDMKKFNRVLDVGCGIGQGVAIMRNEGIEAYGIDISEKIKPFWEMGNISQFCQVACADKIPFPDDHFDLVICTEVMEHIPEDAVRNVLNEIKRVGKKFFLTIAMSKALHKMPHDESEPHICVKSPAWWKDVFEELGFRVSVNLSSSQSSIIVLGVKENKDDPALSGEDLFLQPRKPVQIRGSKLKIQSSD